MADGTVGESFRYNGTRLIGILRFFNEYGMPYDKFFSQIKKNFLTGIVSIWNLIYAAVKFFFTRDVMNATAALTYSSLLATVPIIAVVFAIARGFGLSKYIEEMFYKSFSSQPQAAEIIVQFVNSYLAHARSGVIIGVGLVVMIWTVVNLTRKIEETFNMIWQVRTPRNVFRCVIDYSAMILLVPIFLILSSSISIFMTTFFQPLIETFFLGTAVEWGLRLVPYVFMAIVFVVLYVFMPNTKVRITCAIVPSILAGALMQWLQYIYIYAQMFLSSYNAIYGSFAALPLFMIWAQISWYICIFGCILVFAIQNKDANPFDWRPHKYSHQQTLLDAAMLASLICRRYSMGPYQAYSALELRDITGLPIRHVKELLNSLHDAQVLKSNGEETGDNISSYIPAEDTQNLTLGTMIDRLESYYNDDENGTTMTSEISFRRKKSFIEDNRSVLLKDLSFPQYVK